MLNVGEMAPDFEVKDHAGRTVKLSDYRGKNVVLWFYPKADTPG
jgi:thioredoxin-dependent peroxiredoxin